MCTFLPTHQMPNAATTIAATITINMLLTSYIIYILEQKKILLLIDVYFKYLPTHQM